MPKTLSDEESLPGDGPRPINLRRSGHLPGSEPPYGRCLCCCCDGAGEGVAGGSLAACHHIMVKQESLSLTAWDDLAAAAGLLDRRQASFAALPGYLLCF